MLTFDRETHTYRYAGKVVPSVTTILRPVAADLSMVPADVLERARNLGVAVHKTIELYELDDLDMATLDPSLSQYLADWIDIRAKLGIRRVLSEQPVHSDRWGYAGTPDLQVEFSTGKRGVLDLKRTAAIPKAVGPQTAAYAEAMGDRSMTRGAIHLTPAGAKYVPLNNPLDWQVFSACLVVHRFNQGV